MERLEQVLQRFRAANITLKPRKCRFAFPKFNHLGHAVSAERVQPAFEQLKIAHTEAPIPAYLDFSLQFQFYTDESDTAIGLMMRVKQELA